MAHLVRFPKTHVVHLTPGEMAIADQEGRARQDAIERRGAKSNGPDPNNRDRLRGERGNIIGVMGEIAFAKWSGLPWVASKGADYDDQGYDVGNCEVRTRRLDSDRNLTLKASAAQKYSPNRIYVLAWASHKNSAVRLIGYTTLGTIVDYGNFRTDWNAWVLNWKLLVDLEELNAQR
jgi:hypothetical protein